MKRGKREDPPDITMVHALLVSLAETPSLEVKEDKRDDPRGII